jgi:acyl carrier protein
LAGASIISIVASVLEIPEPEVTDHTGPATESRWTSLRHIQIMSRVQREYAIKLTPRQIRSARSVAVLRRLVDEGRAGERTAGR